MSKYKETLELALAGKGPSELDYQWRSFVLDRHKDLDTEISIIPEGTWVRDTRSEKLHRIKSYFFEFYHFYDSALTVTKETMNKHFDTKVSPLDVKTHLVARAKEKMYYSEFARPRCFWMGYYNGAEELDEAYNKTKDVLWNYHGMIYRDGKWAEHLVPIETIAFLEKTKKNLQI